MRLVQEVDILSMYDILSYKTWRICSNENTMNKNDRIIIDNAVMVGKPIIRGTRITVELIVSLLAQGQTIDEILVAYPHLTRDDILAALRYAGALLEEERVFPMAPQYRHQTERYA